MSRPKLRLLLVGLVACAVVGELGVRGVEAFGRPTGSLYSLIVPQPGHRFVLRPNADLVVPERYGDIRYRLNDKGYRDIDREPTHSSRRILVLGDSVSFGLGVPQDQIYSARLEQSVPKGMEVANLAVFAYDSNDEEDAYREDGIGLHPELVLLQFYLNDFTERTRTGASAPATAPTPSLGQRLSAVKNMVIYRSALYRRLNQAATRLSFVLFHDLRRHRFPNSLNTNEPAADAVYLDKHPDDRDVAAFVTLQRIAGEVRAQGSRFLILLSPDEVQLFTTKYDAITARLVEFCASARIECFDPLPDLRASPEKEQLFYDGVHYSPTGHALIARLLAREIGARDLLPSESSSVAGER